MQVLIKICLGLFLISSVSAKISNYQLANGLQLLLKEDHRAPVVVLQVWYKVGASYEPLGVTGISHALEHMMFQGTEFKKIVATNGGILNAETHYDATVFYEQFAKDKLPLMLQLEADRMHNLHIAPDAFTREKQVILEEYKLRLEDVPEEKANLALFATAFLASPYHNPIIGWLHDIQNLSVHDLTTWYQKWYAPNNAVVVIVGDVTPNATYDLVKKYFGTLAPKSIPVLKKQQETYMLGERKVIVTAPANLPYLAIGFNVPSITTNPQEAYALEVLSYLLSANPASRLTKQLVHDQQLAINVASYYNLYSRLDGLFMVTGIPKSTHDIVKLQHEFLQIIAELQKKPFTLTELTRAKQQILAATMYAEDSIALQARRLGILATLGLAPTEYDAYQKHIAQVTLQNIQEVLHKYFIPKRTSIAILQPLKLESHD